MSEIIVDKLISHVGEEIRTEDIYKAPGLYPVNYKGNWSVLSGAYTTGAIVGHNGLQWKLVNNLSNIELQEPNLANSNWELYTNIVIQTPDKTKLYQVSIDNSGNLVTNLIP